MPALVGIRVRVEVRPTEDRDRLQSALAVIFPDIALEDGGEPAGTPLDVGGGLDGTPLDAGGGLGGTAVDAGGFRAGVLQARIADAVAAHMLERGGWGGGPRRNGGPGGAKDGPGAREGAVEDGPWSTRFFINKQAMVMGKLHLGDGGAAMGDVEVRMEFESRPSREALLRWFLGAHE